MRSIIAALVALLLAGAADAVSCTDGKAIDNFYPEDGITYTPVPGKYALASGIWYATLADPESLTVLGSTEACIKGGGYDATLTIAKDADTYYELSAQHGCNRSSCASNQCLVNGVCRDSYEYHRSQAGIAPENTAGLKLERVQIKNHGDGVSLELPSGDVLIRESWLDFIHDDGIEDDFCGFRTITVQDNLIERTNMLFAWDLRSGQSPCEDREPWYIDRNIGELYRFKHNYENKPGHGGVFKDADEPEWNPTIASFTDNIIKMGPVIGSGQVIFPDTDWLTGPCEGNVYLWIGTQATVPVVPSALSSCITVVGKLDSETTTEFLARPLDELGGYSWNEVREGWLSTYFTATPPGCGIGPELALLLPLLGAWRRRARGRT